jgi:hypothetical protein
MRLAALCATVLTGCTTKLESVPDDFAPGGAQTLVVGRIDGDGPDGDIPGIGMGFFDRLYPITFTVVNDESHESSFVECDRKGGCAEYFYVSLPPGSYRFAQVNRGYEKGAPSVVRGFGGRGRNSIDDPAGREPKFSVGDESVVYVGTLEITQVVNYKPAGWYFAGIQVSEGHGEWYDSRPYRRGWSIKDDFDEMLNVFRARYPNITQQPVKRLMSE